MAAADQVTTLADLRRDFLFRLREAASVTATDNAANRYLNIALHDMHIAPGNNAPWAIRRAFLTTHGDYSTGTVTIDVSSSRTAVTGSSTAWNTAASESYGHNNAAVGGKIRFSSEDEVYEVSAVGSDTSITLSESYIQSGDLAASSEYLYYEDEYSMASDYFRMVNARSFSDEWNIPLIGQSQFYRSYPRNAVVGKPKVASLIQLSFSSNTTPRHRILFHPPPDDVYLIPYQYITTNLAMSTSGTAQVDMSADTDEPIVPLRYRHAIVYQALYNWYRDRKDDTRSQEAKAEYTDLMIRVQNESNIGQDRPRIQPYSYFSRGKMGGQRGRRYSTGDEFERLKI